MKWIIASACMLAIACAERSPAPVAVRIGEDACASCRMTVVSIKTAAQIISSGDEPLIFDELGCLRTYLAAHPARAGARVFVADHRTGEWVDAAVAVFTKSALSTPMSSGLLAHASSQSRDADPDAAGGTPAKVLP